MIVRTELLKNITRLVVKLGTTAPPWMRAEKPKVAAPVTELPAGVEGNGAPPTS